MNRETVIILTALAGIILFFVGMRLADASIVLVAEGPVPDYEILQLCWPDPCQPTPITVPAILTPEMLSPEWGTNK